MASIATIFLSTNDVPTSLEAATLQVEIDELLDKISRLQAQVQARRGALSAVRRIPGEILGEIFIHALLLADTTSALDSKGRDSLIRLNLVCKRWREAAVMCHRLWSCVRAEGREISFVLITSWLARAGRIPKRLEVEPEKKERAAAEEDEDEDEDEEDEEGGDSEEEDEGEEEDHEEEEEEEDDEEEEQESDMDVEELEDKEGSEVPNVQPAKDALVQLLNNGVPLDHFGVVFSDPEDLKDLVNNLGEPDPSAKPRPWDGIRSFKLVFTRDYDLDEPNVLGPLVLRLPGSITSFDLDLTESGKLSLEDDEELLRRDPVLHIPQSFAERLNTFSISCDWGAQHIFTLLEHCVNVEIVTLDVKWMECLWTAEYTEYLQMTRFPQIKLPKLHTLRLRNVPPDVISFLRHLKAPVLANLDFEFVDNGLGTVEDYGGHLLMFLTKQSTCAATVNSLRLAGTIKLNPDGLCLILDRLLALTHLALDLDDTCFDDGEDLLDALEKRCKPSFRGRTLRDPEPFLPKLRVLELMGQVTADNFYQLSRFVTSREQTLRPQDGGRLKELVVAYYSKSPSPLSLDSWQRKKLKEGATVVNIHPLAD